MNELEEIFNNNKIENEKGEDFKQFNNFRHKTIKRSKENNKQREQELKIEKKIKSEEKKKFMMQDKLAKKKIENEENKEKLYQLNIVENFFVSLFKKITIFRENKMIYQIYIIYIFIFIISIVSLSYLKYYTLSSTFDNYKKQNYYPYIESEVIKSQNILKIKADEKNNKNMISSLDEQMLFMEIYTKELINKDILKNDNILLNDDNDGNEEEKILSYEDYLGENFKITDNIKNIIKDEGYSGDNNLKNLNIYYYNFVPVVYQYLESVGLNIRNFYFLGNPSKCEGNYINNLLFKFPLEKNNFGIDISPQNDKIYDYIIDPFIECNNGFDINKDNYIVDNNWYYKLYKDISDKEINFRLFQIMKINQINKRHDYYIAFNKFNGVININNNEDDNKNDNIDFLFAIRISKIDIGYPFIKFSIYNDTLIYDFLSIYNFNFNNDINDMSNIWEDENNHFHNDYDIDNEDNIIFKNPKFIENMGYFGLQNKNKENQKNNNDDKNKETTNNIRVLKKESDDSKLDVDNIIMLKYKEINNIDNNYEYNYYYKADILYYKLIYFFNQFLQYKKKYPNYLISNLTEETEESTDEINKNLVSHPCSIKDIDKYYSLIKSEFNYDCIYDYCYFHNCEPEDSLYIKRNGYDLPNCYCLPLFCKDEETQKNSEFEKKIREELGIENEEFDFSFTSNYEYFMYELKTPFSKVNEFFDRSNFNFKCQIEFDKKNKNKNKSFFSNIYETNYKNDSIFLMYLYNLENLRDIIDDLSSHNSYFSQILILIYIVLCIVLGIAIFIYVHFLCIKLINKMNRVKNIRKTIISNANNNTNENNNDSKQLNKKKITDPLDCNELLIKDNNNINLKNENKNNENEILIKEEDESKKNQDKIKTKKKNENIEEEDELDELIKLINSNLSVFKIEFNLNEESNDNLNNIKRQYEEIIQVNKFKNKLLLKEKSKKSTLNINTDSNNTINSSENENNKKKEKIEDLSVNVFCELLSLSNPKIDFSSIKTNFYYKENKDNTLYGLKNVLENMNEGNNVENIDIINIEKLQNALEHYETNIHNYWKNYYETQKNKDEI